MSGPHESNLEKGLLEGRAASHGGEGNNDVVRNGLATASSTGCVTAARNNGWPGNLGDPQPLDVVDVEYAQRERRSKRKADGKRESEGPIGATTTGNGVIAPGPGRAKGARA